jgi:hypothetical protein
MIIKFFIELLSRRDDYLFDSKSVPRKEYSEIGVY